MKLRAPYLAAVFLVALAPVANATIIGSTYDFTASTTGNTQIGATNGTYTDPANPGFCVGPPVACGSGSGVSGTFAFASVLPGLDTITFTFFGSTSGAGPGTFVINLDDFVGLTITGVSYVSGSLGGATFGAVFDAINGLTFTGSTGSNYNAIGGNSVTFNVTSDVPEPASLALLGSGLLGLALMRRRRKRV